MILVSVKELAAYLGVSESAVRQVVRRKGVARVATGVRRAGLYRANDVLRHTGHRDRLPSP